MNLFNENKSFNLILLIYFASLPFVFISSILEPYLLARQLLTIIFLLLILTLLLKKSNTIDLFTLDATTLFYFGFIVFCGLSFLKSQMIDFSHASFSKYLIFFIFFLIIKLIIIDGYLTSNHVVRGIILFGILALFIIVLPFIKKTINGQNLFLDVHLLSGTFGNKNFLSSIFFMCLPFYFVGISISKKIKVISITAIFFTVILLILFRTRTVLVALSIYVLLILCHYIKNKFSKKFFIRFLLSLTIIVIMLIYYFINIKNDLHSSSDIKTKYFLRLFSSDTFFKRLEYWEQATFIIKDNFFDGIGVGNWIATYPKYGLHHFSDIDIQNGKMLVNYPHNDFLMVLSEIGIFGFLCYLGIFISVLYQAYWLSRNDIKSIDRKNAGYFLYFIICYLIIAFFDFPLTRIEHQILLVIVFSLINSKYVQVRNMLGFKVSSRFIYIFSFLILIYCSIILLYRINGETHLFKALEAEKRFDNKTAIFELNKARNPFFAADNFALPLDWHLGKAYYNEGDFKESLYYYQNAYKINPYSIVVNNDLASASIKNGKVKEAISHYKEALSISPHYQDARLNLAATYYNIQEYEKAFETIDLCDGNFKNDFYKQILTPIVEKKLNLILIHINNPNLNSYLKSKIKTENELLTVYFDYKNNSVSFERYIQSLIN